MTRHRSPRARASANAWRKEYNRKKSPEEDFMRNLIAMGTPSSTIELIDSVHTCKIGACHNQTTVMLCWPHWEPVTLCKRHETMRKAKRTK